MRKTKILLATQCDADTTSFLRAQGVFSHASIRDYVDIRRKPDGVTWPYDWSHFLESDVVYLHRCSTRLDYHIIERCKQVGCKLWIDCDDALDFITPDNPHYETFSSDETKEIIKHGYLQADVLTVGAPYHQKYLRDTYNVDSIVIPNSVDDRLLRFRKPWCRNNKVSWRGSTSHTVDLLYFQNEIGRVIGDFGDREFCFFGVNPYWLNWLGSDYKWVRQLNLFEYYKALTDRNASYHFVPLALSSPFNHVKSNLAWSDATFAGSVVLVPNLPEYIRPGAVVYECGNPIDFESKFRDVLQMSDADSESHVETSFQWICDNILLSKLNEKRIEILKNL